MNDFELVSLPDEELGKIIAEFPKLSEKQLKELIVENNFVKALQRNMTELAEKLMKFVEHITDLILSQNTIMTLIESIKRSIALEDKHTQKQKMLIKQQIRLLLYLDKRRKIHICSRSNC